LTVKFTSQQRVLNFEFRIANFSFEIQGREAFRRGTDLPSSLFDLEISDLKSEISNKFRSADFGLLAVRAIARERLAPATEKVL